MTDGGFTHEPVLLERVVELFDPVPPGTIVDCTLGGAGHASAILASRSDLDLVGIDRDGDALAAAAARLALFGRRVRVVRARFDDISRVISELGITGVSGVLFDLGVSSPQLDRPERGFSFRNDGPLDMRMDQRQPRTASTVVNEYTSQELAEVLKRFGDERFARRIAAAVVEARPITGTAQLADIVRDAIPAATRRTGGHPARRSFQAIRMEVNEELVSLRDALDAAVDMLTPGGRAVAMSYHSGEDRLVKERFRLAETGGCVCPQDLPCGCGATAKVRFVRRGSERATGEEIERNPRAESVRLRVVEALPIDADSGPNTAAS